MRPVISRMNVEVRREGDEYFAVNNLGFSLYKVVVRLPDGGYAQAETIVSGGQARL